MGQVNPPAALRELHYGKRVTKAAATLPNSGSSVNLYTVAGGAVIVTSLIGIVTTALSGTTGAISLGSAPTIGTAEAAGIATATVVGAAEAGTLLTVQGSSGLAGALVVGTLLAGNAVYPGDPFVVSAGTITLKTTIATMTGQVKWYLTYVGLDDGASVS